MATRFCWVFVGLIVATSMVAAIAGDWNFLGGPACCGPSFGMVTLKPGCCETPPSCCRGVWEGYCESKRAGGVVSGLPMPTCDHRSPGRVPRLSNGLSRM